MTHNTCINGLYTVPVPVSAHKYTEITVELGYNVMKGAAESVLL
jgi:hypothetical protein